MHDLCIVGTSWRHSDVRQLERYAIQPDQLRERLAGVREQIGSSELIYLSTCNRVETILICDGRTPHLEYRERVYRALTGENDPVQAKQGFRVWGGEGAVEHLFLTAAGLESAQVGEQEIVAQLRRAWVAADQAGTLGPKLRWVMDQAMRVAKRVQTESALRVGHASLSEIAVRHIQRHLAGRAGTVALIGNSEMTQRCAKRLVPAGYRVHWVNRSVDAVTELAAAAGQEAVSLEEFVHQPFAVDAIVSATGAPYAVLAGDSLARLNHVCEQFGARGTGPLLIDFAIPPDIEPDSASELGLQRIGMEQMVAAASQASEQRREHVADARVIVDESLDRFQERLASRAFSVLGAGIQRCYKETSRRSVKELLAGQLRGLDEQQSAAVKGWAENLAHRFAHLPTVGLRAMAAEHGFESVRTYLEASDDPMNAELRDLSRSLDDLPLLPDEESSPVRIRIGTRSSALARAQANRTAARLEEQGHSCEIHLISTAGDRDQTSAFHEVGAPGIFVREIEQALLDSKIDVAVHSYKDLPTQSPDGLIVAALPERRDVADVLIQRTVANPKTRRSGATADAGVTRAAGAANAAADGASPAVRELPLAQGASVATSSARRIALLKALRPDLEIRPIRGNVPTRVKKVQEGHSDSLLLAAAGLDRLGESDEEAFQLARGWSRVRLDPAFFHPAPAQGALALQTRASGTATDAIRALHRAELATAVDVERAVLAGVEGGCQVAFGAWCRPAGDGWALSASYEVGDELLRYEGSSHDPHALAQDALANFLPPKSEEAAHE